jgi:hypothetical protein
MSFNVTLDERPRMFSVKVGYYEVGTIKSFNYKDSDADDDSELYLACRIDERKEDGKTRLGYFSTMEAAVKEIIEFHYGSSKISKITERPV